MKQRYMLGVAKVPQPALGGRLMRPRPMLAVRVFGPGTNRLIDGLLDTGSDDTVFPNWLAAYVGIDLSTAVEHDVALAGRGRAIRGRYTQVTMRITDAVETYEWEAVVGFVPVPLRHALLGYAGFLQFFDADFRGADLEVLLTPNRTFPGRRI